MENPKKMKTKMNREKFLNDLYYSLDSHVAFAGKEKLIKEAKQKDDTLTRKDVDASLNKQLPYTSHKPVRLKFKTRPVMVYDMDELWQMDLVDLSKLSCYN